LYCNQALAIERYVSVFLAVPNIALALTAVLPAALPLTAPAVLPCRLT